MSYNYQFGDGLVYSTTLPSGNEFAFAVDYTSREAAGVTALLVISGISFLAVLGLLSAIVTSAWITRKSPEEASLFIRTHVAVYFVNMILCDGLQAVGSLMSARWVEEQMVQYGTYCAIQAVIKQAADVGTATWSLAIAVHTFNVLFLGIAVPRYVMYITVMSGWAFICTIVFIIPAALDTVDKGPFFAISGMWCWISPQYSIERIVLDYMEMFISLFLCFILYTLVFLRMRGVITRENGQWFMSFKTARRNSIGKDEKFGRSIARRMIWYPVAYTALLVPISLARFLDWSGVDVPFEATLFCDAVFLLSGVVNVAMFFATRSLLPRKAILVVISKPVLESSTTDALPDADGPRRPSSQWSAEMKVEV